MYIYLFEANNMNLKNALILKTTTLLFKVGTTPLDFDLEQAAMSLLNSGAHIKMITCIYS